MQLTLKLWPFWLIVGLALLFRLLPGIDLWFAGLFHDPQDGFFLGQALPVQFSYYLFRYMPFFLVPLLFWLLYASWRWGGISERPVRRSIVFLCVTLAIGPGIMVNSVLKAESGRARPSQIEQFGGDKTFSPAFVIADQCEKNCSFVSGHAGMGFFFLAFAWVLHDRRWLLYGGLIGAAAGLGRIAQGAHFLSDVIFSGVVVLLTALLCARWILGRWSPEQH